MPVDPAVLSIINQARADARRYIEVGAICSLVVMPQSQQAAGRVAGKAARSSSRSFAECNISI